VRRSRYRKRNQLASIVESEIVLYGLLVGTIGIVGYAVYNAIKNATAGGTASNVAAGAATAELGPGGSTQPLGGTSTAGGTGAAGGVAAATGSVGGGGNS
jgi:hypothetical protein